MSHTGRSPSHTAGRSLCDRSSHARKSTQYFGSSACFVRGPRTQQSPRKSILIRAEGSIKEGELVSSEDEFFTKVTKHKGPLIVDWMAKWCRKCIYLKPKLEKMINQEFPGLDVVFIDVNSIPGGLVIGHGIKKMPTITIFKDGEKLREHVAAEQAPRAINIVKMMVADYLDLNPEDKKLAMTKK